MHERINFREQGVEYVLSMMHKCIVVKVGGSPKNEKERKQWEFINYHEIGGIYIAFFRNL